DEPSASLLHYVLRTTGTQPVAVVASCRTAELAANTAARRLVEALRRDDQLLPIAVGPLDASAIAQLTMPIAPDSDATLIAADSNAHPLYAIEMSRGLARGDDALTSRLDALIGDRLRRLSGEATALVPWLPPLRPRVAPPRVPAHRNT